MKKLILLSIILCLKLVSVKAQWVTIPDANFVTKLTALYPSCMNGNQLDTTCTQIVNATSLNIRNSNISNISGIEYFNNLTIFNCNKNQIVSITSLPNNLIGFSCDSNLITSLPVLPNSLQNVRCLKNQLTALPSLPATLLRLDCGINQFTTLPTLSANLHYISFWSNQITSLPILPNTLDTINFSNNQLALVPALPGSLLYINFQSNAITSLPALPASLKFLACGFNQLTVLPALPSTLEYLSCLYNQFTVIPTLPATLTYLQCMNNLIPSLPSLPINLEYLNCSTNLITSLPTLPATLEELYCSYNQITALPALSNSLNRIDCNYNLLSTIPTLPTSLVELNCFFNQITNLPNLPSTLTTLRCYNNLLTSLPAFPPVLQKLKCGFNQLTSIPDIASILMLEYAINDNNIYCLNELPQIIITYADISNNPMTCIPNICMFSSFGNSFPISNLPLCYFNDQLNNPNSCNGVNITGLVYSDLNGNCALNNNDLFADNIPVKLYDSQNNFLEQSYTVNGIYSFTSLLPDSFHVKIDDINLPIAINCGVSNNLTVGLDSTNQTVQGINFPIMCDTTYDINALSVGTMGFVFPGQSHLLLTNITNNESWYNIDCGSAAYSGTVKITVTGPVTYSSYGSNALIPQVNGNTFTYNISNFNNLNPNSFNLYFLTDTTALVGAQVCANVEIISTPIDGNPANNTYNYCYQVINSLDPNMKEVYPVNVAPGYNDWFTYTIHFQNTGNAPAFNIRLKDTLDSHLDLNTFEVLGYSHTATTSLYSNILTVRFNDIMLPDSTSDEEGSKGYFQYRIKPLANLPLGSNIPNTAYIYFDYNTAVITNTTHNNFVTGIAEQPNSIKQNFILYPNPSNGVFNFMDNSAIKTVEVFNLLGEQIISQTNHKQINLTNYSKGIYFAKINGNAVIKLVKD